MTIIMTNTTLYLGENLFGKIDSFKSPDVEFETTEIKTGFGTIEVPVGLKAMSGSLTLTSFEKKTLAAAFDAFSAISMTLYGSLDKFENDSLVDSEQAKLILRASAKKASTFGEVKPQELAKPSFDFSISAAKMYIGNTELLYVDVPNFIYRKNGRDMVAHIKKNLALN